MNQTNEIYPMPSFVRLASVDIDVSRKWYLRLGFTEIYAMNAPDGSAIMSHLRWAKYADLMHVQQRNAIEDPPGSSLTLYFTTERGMVDQIANRAPESIVEGPLIQPGIRAR